MTTGSVTGGARRGLARRTLVWAVLLALAIVAGGLLVARSRSEMFWLGGTVVLEGRVNSEAGSISIETGDWTYGMSPEGASWTDGQGSWHEGGRPSCLVEGDHTSIVRFAAVQVTADGRTWRPIVWIDCRGTRIDGASAAGSTP